MDSVFKQSSAFTTERYVMLHFIKPTHINISRLARLREAMLIPWRLVKWVWTGEACFGEFKRGRDF